MGCKTMKLSRSTSDIPFLRLKNGYYKGKCVNVINGDVICVNTFYNGKICQFLLKLARINCPTSSTKLEESKDATLITELIYRLLIDEFVDMYIENTDTYNRPLAEIIITKTKLITLQITEGNILIIQIERGTVLNDWLLEHKLAWLCETDNTREYAPIDWGIFKK